VQVKDGATCRVFKDRDIASFNCMSCLECDDGGVLVFVTGIGSVRVTIVPPHEIVNRRL